MALVIHELTTNAVRHGALASPSGRVDVTWEADGGPKSELTLRWRESGGRQVAPPQRFGFGLTHIRGSINHQLGGKLDLQWREEGMECVLKLPTRQLVPASD